MFIVYLQLFTYNTIFNIIHKIHNNSLICMYMHTHNHTHRCVTNYIYTCTAQWYRKMCTLGVFGKRADFENHPIFEHIFHKVTMWTHFSKWLGFVRFSVLPAHSPLVLKHIPPDQP